MHKLARRERRLIDGWRFRPEDASGNPIEDWIAVQVPSAWQRYPGAWNHRGRARYRIRIPPALDPGGRQWLRFDGVHYLCRIFFEGQPIGSHEGGWDPFWIPIPASGSGEGVLEVEVEAVGPDLAAPETTAGFLPDCGILPSGIWKDVHLVETGDTVIEGALLEWVPSKNTLRVKPVVARLPGAPPVRIAIKLCTAAGDAVAAADADQDSHEGSLDLEVPSPRLWRIEDPYLYSLRVIAEELDGRVDCFETRTGLRHLSARAERLLLNGEPVMARGALHWGYDPGTIAPNGNEKDIARELNSLKDQGFNLVKHCLYVPHDAYFRLADELGMLQWLELPMWLPSGSKTFQRRAGRELPRIAAAAQHHPSLVLYSLGCELNDRLDARFLGKLFRSVRRLTPNALLCDNSGSGDCYGGPETGMSDYYDYHFYTEPCNLPGLMDTFGAPWRKKKPWLFGEFCDSDGFRDLEAVRAGLEEHARWWMSKDPSENVLLDKSRVQRELGCLYQEERLEALGLAGRTVRLMEASRRHSMTHRKRTLEIARQYPRTCGYVITGIRDTAITTSGVFDDLGKPRFDVEKFRAVNSDDLLLLLPPPRRAWVHGGDRRSGFDLHHQVGGTTFAAQVCASLFGPVGSRAPYLRWRLVALDGRSTVGGSLRVAGGAKKGFRSLGSLQFELPDVSAWTPYTLEVSWPHEQGATSNRWPLWIHPASHLESVAALHLHDPSGALDLLEGLEGGEDALVWVSSELDDATRKRLESGRPVILVQVSSSPLESVHQPFWREAILLIEEHSLTAGYPFQDGGGEELFALTTDRFFTGWLAKTGFTDFIPILVRLDARSFTSSCALAELKGYPGRCLATTLGILGGMGDQPFGSRNNRGGQALLAAMGDELSTKDQPVIETL